MAQFVLCVHVVIWWVLRVPAIDFRSKPRYEYFIKPQWLSLGTYFNFAESACSDKSKFCDYFGTVTFKFSNLS